MGKDSEYYKKKRADEKERLSELEKELPDFARKYIDDKRLQTQVSTLVQYTYDIITFFKFLKQSNPVFRDRKTDSFTCEDLDMLTEDDIKEYQRFLEYSRMNDGTVHENGNKGIARRMTPLRGMFLYCVQRNYIKKNSMDLVKRPRIKKDKDIIRLNNDEVRELIDATEMMTGNITKKSREMRTLTQKRDLAIVLLLLGTGMRVSECSGLDLKDISLVDHSAVVVRKGGAQDIVYFNDEVAEALKDYIRNERPYRYEKADEDQKDALFFSLKGKRISVDSIEVLIKKISSTAVPGKKITPHKLRSSYGTALYRETKDIKLVASVLGHENISTTSKHYIADDEEEKKRAINLDVYKKDETDKII